MSCRVSLCVALIGLTVGCGGLSSQTTIDREKLSVIGFADDALLNRCSHLLAQQRPKEALQTLRQLSPGAREQRQALALRALACFMVDDLQCATSATRKLVQIALLPHGRQAWRDTERVMRFVLETSHGFRWLWNTMEPFRRGPKLSSKTLHLHERMLGGARHVSTQHFVQSLKVLRLWRDSAAIDRIAKLLIANQQHHLVEAIVTHDHSLGLIRAWTLQLQMARHRRGGQLRSQWLERLAKTAMSSTNLRRLLEHREVQLDAEVHLRVHLKLIALAEATDTDRIVAIGSLSEDWRYRVTGIGSVVLRQMANHFTGSESIRRALAAALLTNKAVDFAARVLGPVRSDTTAEQLVLHAEVHRQRGQLQAMRQLAQRAYDRSERSMELCEEMADLWAQSAPKFAAHWRSLLSPALRPSSLRTLESRALAALRMWAPAADAVIVIEQYARKLAMTSIGDAKAGLSHRTQCGGRAKCLHTQSRKSKITRFVRKVWSRHRRRKWRSTVQSALRILANGPQPAQDVVVKWAIAATSSGDTPQAQRAWRQLRASQGGLSAKHKAQLVGSILSRADATLMTKLIQECEVSPADVNELALPVAKLLMSGNHRLMGRQWIEAALLKDPLSRWPSMQGPASVKRPTTRPKRLSMSFLHRLVRSGAADLVLRYLESFPNFHTRHARQKLARELLQIEAMVAIGEVKRAEQRLLREVATGPTNRSQDAQILALAARMDLCDVVLTLAQRMVRQNSARSVRRALDSALRCAQQAQSVSSAYRVIRSLTQHQLRLSHHLYAAKRLVLYGFPNLAVHVFEQSHQGRSPRRSRAHLHTWSRALIMLGRSKDALHLLKEMTKAYGRRPPVWRNAVELLRRNGFIKEALQMNQQALALHGTDSDLLLSCLKLELMTTRTDTLTERLQSLASAGASEQQWAEIIDSAIKAGLLQALHRAVTQVQDSSRGFDRFRVWLASEVGDRAALSAGVRRLRARGPLDQIKTIESIANVGMYRQARDASEDLVARQSLGRRRASVFDRINLAVDLAAVPTSASSALALSRLAVGRSLDPHKTAAEVARALEKQGHMGAAFALGQFAESNSPADALMLCAQGRRAAASGNSKRALEAWRRAFAHVTLSATKRGRRPMLVRIRRCLLQAATAAGYMAESERWLRQWRALEPQSVDLWARSIRLAQQRGRSKQAVRLLVQASQKLKVWSRKPFEAIATNVTQLNAGVVLLEMIVSNSVTIRTEPWWVALLYGLCLKYDPNSSEELRRQLVSLSQSDAKTRAALSLAMLRHGEVSQAIEQLGNAPLRQNGQRTKTKNAKPFALQATASTLIAHHEEQIAGIDANKRLSAATQRLLDRWVFGISSRRRLALAEELVIQGAPGLATDVLSAKSSSTSCVRSIQTRMRQLRVAAATASDQQLLIDAKAAFRPGLRWHSRSAKADHRTMIVQTLLSWGRPAVALKVLEKAPLTVRQSLPKWMTTAGLKSASMDHSTSPNGRNSSHLAPDDLSLATSPLKTAIERIKRYAQGIDDNWLAWVLAAESALRVGRHDLLRYALKSAQAADAPVQRLHCLMLATGQSDDLKACIEGRALTALSEVEIYALTLAVARHPRTSRANSLPKRFASVGTMGLARWIAALAASAKFGHRAGAARAAHEALHRVVGQAEHQRLLHFALDDLAELGVLTEALKDAQRSYHQAPEARGHRNNLAYAHLLAGHSAEAALKLARPALKRRGGQSVEALMDTIATALWKLGRRRQALAAQRLSLTSSRSNAKYAQLPLIRFAEMLVATGKREAARQIAHHALTMSTALVNRAEQSSLDDAQGILPMLQAHHTLIARRAYEVMRSCATDPVGVRPVQLD